MFVTEQVATILVKFIHIFGSADINVILYVVCNCLYNTSQGLVEKFIRFSAWGNDHLQALMENFSHAFTGNYMFGFSEFISGFFLLSIVYTTTGIRFKFRMAVARLPLFSKAVSFLIIAIGFSTLCIDLFPTGYQFSIQFFLGFLFLLLTSYVYYVYVCPSKFSENNSEKYAKELFNIISKGSDSELRIIGHELATAAASLIRFCREIPITKEVIALPRSGRLAGCEQSQRLPVN